MKLYINVKVDLMILTTNTKDLVSCEKRKKNFKFISESGNFSLINLLALNSLEIA